jgi:hypothetical protein
MGQHILRNRPRLHHKLNLPKYFDVGERITFDSYQVGVLACLDCADAVLPTQQIRGVDGCCANRFDRRHSPPVQRNQFFSVSALFINVTGIKSGFRS